MDRVFEALGAEVVDYSLKTRWCATPGLRVEKHGNLKVDMETGKTTKVGVFAGGDVATGAATVIEAMGAGKRAARAIDEYLRTGVW